MIKLNAKELRISEPSVEQIKSIRKNPIYIILDNVLDTYNVGAIFRLADAVAAEKVYLCGETLTPPNSRIKKASINTWQWVEWEYCETAEKAIEQLKKKKWEVRDEKLEREMGNEKLEISSQKIPLQNPTSHIPRLASIHVVAVEQDERSIPYTQMKMGLPVAIVVGNETYGVSKEVLEMADQIVEIPMFGVNKSLNVMVSLGIVSFKIMEKISKKSLF